MTTPTTSATPPQGTAQQAPPPRDAALTPRARARLAEIRARNALVVQLTNESWGAKLTPLQQRAFAEYARRFRLDISEMDNLGGRPYRNGRYYMRRCAELVAEGRVEWYKGDHIGPHADLATLALEGDEWARGEIMRRRRERIRQDVPIEATHAYVVSVKIKEMSVPVEGCKFYVPGRKKKVWKNQKQIEVNADPVGDENPQTTVETRAWRRVGRLAFAEIPELREEEERLERAADDVEATVIEEAVRAEESNERAGITPHPIDHGGDDPYGNGAPTQRALTEGAMQPIVVPSRGERVASTVPDGPDPDDEVEFIDDTDIMND